MSNSIKGYKALSKDMTAIIGNGMQFELEKEYTITGELELCRNGFHFCKKIEDLNSYYPILKSRIFEIEASGTIKFNGSDKYVCESIKLVRELSQEEIKEYFELNYKDFINNPIYNIQYLIATYGYGFDILINDRRSNVREVIANHGYGLDVLINDNHPIVRLAVAKQGYGLDILVNDNHPIVRLAVAKQGYGLDILVNDKCESVRQEVAKQGYGLDVLVRDKSIYVRLEVAKQGYGLHVLIKDKDEIVRNIAKYKLAELN